MTPIFQALRLLFLAKYPGPTLIPRPPSIPDTELEYENKIYRKFQMFKKLQKYLFLNFDSLTFMIYLFQKFPRVNHLKCQSDEDDGRMQAIHEKAKK